MSKRGIRMQFIGGGGCLLIFIFLITSLAVFFFFRLIGLPMSTAKRYAFNYSLYDVFEEVTAEAVDCARLTRENHTFVST